MLTELKKIHFVGIGGSGMSAIARVLLEQGYKVSGSDLSESEIVKKLKALGADIYQGHKAEHVNGVDAIVVSTAIAKNNPEVVAAIDNNIPVYHRSDIVATLLNNEKGIAVAGAHGKTTTTSMLAVLLDVAGIDPTAIIGGEVDYLQSNAKLGNGEYLVAEADESDGSFLKLLPEIAIVTNIENDHMDYYGSMENILATFKKFLGNLSTDTGLAVLCFDNDYVKNLAPEIAVKYVSYALNSKADYMAKNIVADGANTLFDVYKDDAKIGSIKLNVPGKHNVANALAAIVVCLKLGIDFETMQKGFDYFNGAKRRFQTKGKTKGIWVVDDYAHHPTEIATTLVAARQTKPHRLICAFQPHRYSRTNLLFEEFVSCFKESDILILTEIYSAGEAPIAGVTGKLLAERIKEQIGQEVVYIEQRSDISQYLADIAKDGDLIMTMGAGDIFLTGEELLESLNK